jgi:hypothetical protein
MNNPAGSTAQGHKEGCNRCPHAVRGCDQGLSESGVADQEDGVS